jgi:predicted amidophosphoribosyltransferase
MREFGIIVALVGAAAVAIVVQRGLSRRALRRLVRRRFYSGLCIMCGADLRFGKEKCPKCGHKYDRIAAMVWDNALERRKNQE